MGFRFLAGERLLESTARQAKREDPDQHGSQRGGLRKGESIFSRQLEVVEKQAGVIKGKFVSAGVRRHRETDRTVRGVVERTAKVDFHDHPVVDRAGVVLGIDDVRRLGCFTAATQIIGIGNPGIEESSSYSSGAVLHRDRVGLPGAVPGVHREGEFGIRGCQVSPGKGQ